MYAGLGFQFHLTLEENLDISYAAIVNNFKKFADLG